MKKHLYAVSLCLVLLALMLVPPPTASAHWEFHDLNGQFLFGYTGVESAAEYENEVKSHGIKTNLTTVSTEWTTNIGPALTRHNDAGNKVAIFLDTVLFEPASPAWYLRPDYRFIFDSWYNRNKSYLTPSRVAILIINSEANNRGLGNAALDTATAYVKSKIPTIPTIVGYGFGDGSVAISGALPAQPDGFAFWRYAELHPEAPGSQFQFWLNHFKTRIDTSRQRLLIVFDAHYGPWHVNAGMTQEMVGDIAIRYADVVRNEPLLVGMLGFTWEGFGDILGLRDVSQDMRLKNKQAGCMLLPCP